MLPYFFLVVFLVAFFFIALLSLGLDLLVVLPGFFLAGIRVPPVGSLLRDELQNLTYLSSSAHIIEIRYAISKRYGSQFRKKF